MRHIFKKQKILLVAIAAFASITLISCKNDSTFVFFETNGGQKISSQVLRKIDYNKEVVPLKDNHNFEGWYVDVDLDTKFESINRLDRDLYLYAKWSQAKSEEPDLVSLYENAYDKHVNAPDLYVEALGTTVTNVPIIGNINQKIKSIKQVKDGNYYQYTASHSSLANMMYEAFGNTNTVEVKRGSVKANLSINKVDSQTNLSREEYLAHYGVYPNELNYIVTNDTVVYSGNYKFVDGKHKFTLQLDLESSVAKYIKNIKATNKYDSEDAQFEFIELSVQINANGYFEEISYKEQYNVRVNAPIVGWRKQSMNAEIIEKFTYDEKQDLIKYSEGA